MKRGKSITTNRNEVVR